MFKDHTKKAVFTERIDEYFLGVYSAYKFVIRFFKEVFVPPFHLRAIITQSYENGKSQVAVGIKIDTKHRQYIKKDSKIKISADGLIGNKLLVIVGGTTRSGAVEEGDTLLVEKTFSSEEILNMFQENNKNVLAITSDFKNISKKIVAGEGRIGKRNHRQPRRQFTKIGGKYGSIATQFFAARLF